MRISLQEAESQATAFTLKQISLALLLLVPLVGFAYVFVRRVVTVPLQAITRGLRTIASG